MTKQGTKEYLDEIRQRYQGASRPEQGVILDEAEKVTKLHRKHLIRVLNIPPVPRYPKAVYPHAGQKKKPGPQPKYGAPELLQFLITVWHASWQACSKRLKSLIPLWLSKYQDATGIALSLVQQVLILEMSPSTIDRLLQAERQQYRGAKGRATTKPGTLCLRKQVPIRTDQWEERCPGHEELDTVAHCGTSMEGMFAYSLNVTDLASSWTESQAIWGRGERGVNDAFARIEKRLPFPLLSVDSDNGGEFINHLFIAYFRDRKRPVKQTRSREYQSNDNAHIEQKNWTNIRQLLGYGRFDNQPVVALMNDLYEQEYRLLNNFFLPSVKLQEKERIGSKIIKRHDKPLTPCQRLLRSRVISKEIKEWLREQERTLNPFLLQKTVQEKVRHILRCASLPAPSPSSSSKVRGTPTALTGTGRNNHRRNSLAGGRS